MARKKKNKPSYLRILIAVILINAIIYMVFNNNYIEKLLADRSSVTSQDALVDLYTEDAKGSLQVHYIDVGQGDAILVEQDGKYMLIDAGPNSSRSVVENYLKSHNVNQLEYVVATHNHEDHIGGMANIIKKFKVNKILASKCTATSKTYENFVLAAKEKNLTFYAPTKGESFDLGLAKITILADGSNRSENTNNNSIVIKIAFGENSFLFTGDAEEELELEVASGKIDIKTDVLKISHHGSNTSTCKTFLNAADPKYAVIFVGKNNNYGHPCKSVMQRLKASDIIVYRTDESSHIVAKSDGKNIYFNVQSGSYSYISAN